MNSGKDQQERNSPMVAKPSTVTGILKLQTFVLALVTLAELIMPYQVVLAFDKLDINLGTEPFTFAKQEQIVAPEKSLIMLEGEELEHRQKEVEAEYKEKRVALASTYMTVSAYNSVPGQTDGSPFRTAVGSLTRDGIVASNYYPIGTRVRIPDHFGDKEFVVEDRMNPRYDKVLDIWMEEIPDAKAWGRRVVKIEVVEWGKGRSEYRYKTN